VVVSGGALGIDAAAHRGALRAGGRTWAVAGTGCEHCFPPQHAELFDEISASAGAMIWPFAPASATRPGGFLLRNRVLVALADAVVIAQAGLPSGALRAAECARKAGKPLWVVPASPWAPGFEGSRKLLDEGIRPLTSIDALVPALGRFSSDGPLGGEPSAPTNLDPTQSAILRVISIAPLHLDEIALRAYLTIQVTAAALLTLALEAVVVEGPPGFFRRRDGA
jgi:DNA processing protein